MSMSFDLIAPFYRALETLVFGNALQRARVTFLGELCGRVLVAGEGNGRCLEALLRENEGVCVTCIEQSARMIQLAHRRLGNDQLARVNFINSDIREVQLHHQFDAIVTNFFLDCFEERELPSVIDKLASAASREARWIVADFHVPIATASRILAKLLIGTMYGFFRLTTGIT